MVNFIIAGKPDCRNFLQVLHSANILKNNLPCFDFTKIEFSGDDWREYLLKTNKMYRWYHESSPLIYKEIFHYGTRTPQLIGGAGEFWEYCYEYYGVQNPLDEQAVDKLLNQNLRGFEDNARHASMQTRTTFKILIYGASSTLTTIFLPELMKIDGLGATMQIFVYDEGLSASNYDFFDDFNDEFKNMFAVKPQYCEILKEGIVDCNLLLLIDDTSHLQIDNKNFEMRSHLIQLAYLAEEINLNANRDLRVIFAGTGHPSLMATILARRVRIIPHSQIVAVSSDQGFGYLGELSRQLQIHAERMCAPPVWGFIGLNEFVDVGSTLIKCNIYKPYARTVHAPEGSTLTHGTIHSELRFINYLSDSLTDLKENVEKRREIVRERLGRPPIYAKVEALISLIRIWFGCSPLKEPIISLGVMSDGSFNITPKLVFSQPAIQFRDGWVPFSNYPVPSVVRQSITDAAEAANKIFSSLYEDDVQTTYEAFQIKMSGIFVENKVARDAIPSPRLSTKENQSDEASCPPEG